MTELQKEALAALADVWRLSPDVRLGQLLAHLDFLSNAHMDKGLGTIDDDELLAILYRHRCELEGRLSESPANAPFSVSGSSTSPAS
jgi:hypothetical protein